MSDDRDSVYVEDGVVVYRASAVGGCGEALLAMRSGQTAMMPPAWFQEKLDEGTEWEAYIVGAALAEWDGELISSQDEIELALTPNLIIRGHTDGRATGRRYLDDDLYEKIEVGIEAKKLGPSLFKKWQAGLESFWSACPYYRDQLTLYMHATGLPFVYAVGEWDPDKLEVVRVHTKLITTPPGDINQIKAKVLSVEARYLQGEQMECSGGMYPCPVFYLHEEEQREEVDDLALHAAVERYLKQADQEKAAKKAKDEAYRLVEQLMTGRPDKVTVPGAILTRYDHTSTSLNRDALTEAGIDLAQFQIKTKKPRVKVTAKEER